MLCKVCLKEITNKNKLYCSKSCRYKDSWFKKNVPWNKGVTNETNDLMAKISKKKGETLKKRYMSGEISVWNKGQTKETNEILKKIGKSRTGKNNPIYKILQDKQKTKQWGERISRALKGRKRGSYKDQYGVEAAAKLRKRLSESAKKRIIHGHTGKKHSEESKQKMREATSKRIKNMAYKITDTEPMRLFKNCLYEVDIVDYCKEYCDECYSIDFAIVKQKIAIEVDGDFWHANPLKYPNGPVHSIQIKNERYKKNKEAFLSKRGWTIYRFWESDIKNKKQEIIVKLLEIKQRHHL